MNNAIYLEYEWFTGNAVLTDAQINSYLNIMQDNQMNTIFCDIGFIGDDGVLPAAGYAQIGRWIDLNNAYAAKRPGARMKIIPAINYARRKKYANFGDATMNTNLNAAFINLFTQFAIDGIHLDIEAFYDNDTTYLATLQYLKNDGAAGKHLSIATPDFWSPSFITQVAAVVDQLNPMIYDTMGYGSTIVDGHGYMVDFKTVLKKYSDAMVDLNCELVPTFPVYEKKTDISTTPPTVYHDPVVENLRMAVAAANSAINEGAAVHGGGIFYGPFFMGLNPTKYPYYPIDQLHWKKHWLNII